MPLVIACPTCQQKIRAPESVIGRQIKCPQCKTPFVAQDTSSIGSTSVSPGGTVREQLPPPQQDFQAAPSGAQAWPADREQDTDDDAAEPCQAEKKSSRGSFVDYLLFRRMVTPWIIIIVFYLGVAGILIYGVVQFIFAIVVVVSSGGRATGIGLALVYVLAALFGTIFALIVWRVYCEVITTFFRILDNVREINEQLKERNG